jgi:predicted nucleic acid-binding protein
MIAAVCGWHEHHRRAAAELNRRLSMNERMIVAAPALVEAYAVLTRLPPPHRLAAADAMELLTANSIRAGGRLVVLDAPSYRSLLNDSAAREIVGGRTYDAVIARCALRARANALLTFNQSHFVDVAPAGIEIVVP